MATVVGLVAVLTAVPIGVGADDHDGLAPPVFDIEAAPDGSILIAQGTTVREIRRGEVADVAHVPTVGTAECATEFVGCVQGLEAIGRGNFFATSGGLDEAVGAGLWRVSRGDARLVADIEQFETEHDPDAFRGPAWKSLECEAATGFAAGPQSNPYHLAALSGGEALVADAAGNTLLSARTNGEVDWVAVFTPPVDEEGDWEVLFELDDGTECYVQPVPTAVDVGPDGAYYVGELTGAPAVPGTSRVWRIEPGARNVVCPSSECREVISGLTSVIDVEFGPDGLLYVVEFDTNGWLAATDVDAPEPGGGTIQSCDVETGDCDLVDDELLLPGAITFDKRGELWVLDASLIAPEIRQVPLD